MRRWLKSQVSKQEPAHGHFLSTDAFWRSICRLKQAVLLVKADNLTVLAASEEALELFKSRAVRDIGQVLRVSLDPHTLAKLELAVTNQSQFENQPTQLLGPHLDIAASLTVSTLPEYPQKHVALLFVKPEPRAKMPVWTGITQDVWARLPHPVWVTNQNGSVTYSNAAFREFPLSLGDYTFEEQNPAEVARWSKLKESLLDAVSKVRASNALSDLTVDAGSYGYWRVLHFPYSRAPGEGLVCAVAISLAKRSTERVDTPLDEGVGASDVFAARESERQTLGREIHDSLGQELTVLKLEIRRLYNLVLSMGPVNPTVLEHVHSVRDQVNRLSVSARRMAYELKHDFVAAKGLLPTVKELVLDVRNRVGLQTQLEVSPDWVEPEASMAHHLHRSLQEMLNNVAKHAKASQCLVRLGVVDNCYWLEVRDDGIGLPATFNDESLGLRGLRERAGIYNGQVLFKARPEVEGTLVRIELQERRRPAAVPVQPGELVLDK